MTYQEAKDILAGKLPYHSLDNPRLAEAYEIAIKLIDAKILYEEEFKQFKKVCKKKENR